MKYLNKNNKLENNPKIDKFLMELHVICKRNKMCITGDKTGENLIIQDYNKNSARKMLTDIKDNLTIIEDKKPYQKHAIKESNQAKFDRYAKHSKQK